MRTLAKTAATMVIPLVVAVISLLFSMFTWWTTNRAPDVAVGVPSVVRVMQAGDSAWMYVQPHFIVAGATDRVAVVTGLSVTVAPRAGRRRRLLRLGGAGDVDVRRPPRL